jgi:hypothetical protein
MEIATCVVLSQQKSHCHIKLVMASTEHADMLHFGHRYYRYCICDGGGGVGPHLIIWAVYEEVCAQSVTW